MTLISLYPELLVDVDLVIMILPTLSKDEPDINLAGCPVLVLGRIRNLISGRITGFQCVSDRTGSESSNISLVVLELSGHFFRITDNRSTYT